MTYCIKLSEKDLTALLDIIKHDFDYAYNDGDDSDAKAMEEDIDLLKSIAHAFNDENAKMKLDVIISGYERCLRSII